MRKKTPIFDAVKMLFIPLLNDKKEQKRLMAYRKRILHKIKSMEAMKKLEGYRHD